MRLNLPLLIITLLISIFISCSSTEPEAQTSSNNGNPLSDEEGAQLPNSESEQPTLIPGALPGEWPESVPIMDGFSVSHSIEAHEGNLLMVYATGNVNPDEALEFYVNLSGWKKDLSGPWLTEGELIKGVIEDEIGNNLDIMIFSKPDRVEMTLFFTLTE